MGLINWIFDIYQHHRIDQVQKEASAARAEAAVRVGNSVDGDRLDRALGELALAVKTLQRVMVDKGVCTPEEFQSKLQQVDREDGSSDGRSPI